MMYCNVFAATKVKIVDDIRVNGMLALRLTDMSNRRMVARDNCSHNFAV